jgi:hypothetical protein
MAVRSGALIFRTSSPKIALHGQLPDLGVQLLDLALPLRLGVRADARVERPARVLEQLLLPGVDLVRMNLVLPRQIGGGRLLAHRRQRDPRLHRRVDLPPCLLRHRLLRLSGDILYLVARAGRNGAEFGIRTTGAREWAFSGRFPSLSGHFL